ncbi:MAG: hypothetical protein ACTSRZ_13350 [Promethearchaeota archaeon]
MGLGKSFGYGLLIYVFLTFVMNMLLVLAEGVDLGGTPMLIGEFFALASSDPFQFIGHFFAFRGSMDILSGLGLGNLVLGGLVPSSVGLIIGFANGIATLQTNGFLGVVYMLGYLVPPLIGAIAAGKLAESQTQGFFGWFLIPIVCSLVLLVFWIVAGPDSMEPFLPFFKATYDIDPNTEFFIYIGVPIVGLLQGMFWSGISAALGKEI